MDCNKSYKNKASLSRHVKYECGPEHKFKCIYCFKAMKQKYDLKKHVRRRHPERQLEFESIYKDLYKTVFYF
jgi:hypothetical protein